MGRQTLTLPQLDQKLDGLSDGAMHQITRADYERLFGLNDAALGRLRNFAKNHACVASFSDNLVLFRKNVRAPSREAPASVAK